MLSSRCTDGLQTRGVRTRQIFDSKTMFRLSWESRWGQPSFSKFRKAFLRIFILVIADPAWPSTQLFRYPLSVDEEAPASRAWRKTTHVIRSITRWFSESPIIPASFFIEIWLFIGHSNRFLMGFLKGYRMRKSEFQDSLWPLAKGYVTPCRTEWSKPNYKQPFFLRGFSGTFFEVISSLGHCLRVIQYFLLCYHIAWHNEK